MKTQMLCVLLLMTLSGCKRDEKTVTCQPATDVFSTSPDAIVAMNLVP